MQRWKSSTAKRKEIGHLFTKVAPRVTGVAVCLQGFAGIKLWIAADQNSIDEPCQLHPIWVISYEKCEWGRLCELDNGQGWERASILSVWAPETNKNCTGTQRALAHFQELHKPWPYNISALQIHS